MPSIMRPARAALLLVLMPSAVLTAVVFLSAHVSVGATIRDAGEAYRGQRVVSVFTLTNDGSRALVIDRIDDSCATRTTVPDGLTIAPGASRQVQVAVNTAGLPEGESLHEVTLSTNAPMTRTVRLTTRVSVRSEFALSSDHLRLSSDAPRAEVTIRSAGTSDAEVQRVLATDPRVSVSLAPVGGAGGAREVRIIAVADREAVHAWDLGNIVAVTSSQASPEIRIPVRGSLLK